jgi:hypothetical protein
MPFSDDVGGRGQEARGLEEASTSSDVSLARSKLTSQVTQSISQG